MPWMLLRWAAVGGASLSFFYYLLVIVAARRFFRRRREPPTRFTPPVSILKPVRGTDREAYENFASFCRLDYPEYEILFGVTDPDDPSVPVIRKLMGDFPQRSIRLVIGRDRAGANDKVAKLCGLARQARHEILAASDSDIRVTPDYLRSVVAPLDDSRVGAVTCAYRALAESRLGSELEALGVATDFFAGVVAAWQLEGVRFGLGATLVTTRQRLQEIGGFEAIADCLFDDYELGRRIAGEGYRVELLPYTVSILLSSESLRDFIKRRLRWAVGLRQVRPWSHFGLIATQGLAWSLAAAAAGRSALTASGFLASYLLLRLGVAWTVGVRGLEDAGLKKKMWLVPLHDAIGFVIWLASFASNRVEWRGAAFRVKTGRLVPLASRQIATSSNEDAKLEKYGI